MPNLDHMGGRSFVLSVSQISWRLFVVAFDVVRAKLKPDSLPGQWLFLPTPRDAVLRAVDDISKSSLQVRARGSDTFARGFQIRKKCMKLSAQLKSFQNSFETVLFQPKNAPVVKGFSCFSQSLSVYAV